MSDQTTIEAPEMTASTLRDRLEAGRPTTVLDIRPEGDFEEWHIPGSINVDAYEALKEGEPGPLADTSLPTGRPIVTVCGAGKTSQAAAEWLQRQGREVYSLAGGLNAWTFAWNTATVEFPEVPAQIVQVRRTGKGCLSYLVESEGEALVIDPALAPAVYEQIAEERGWRIVGVVDTHIHADHLSRGRLLAERMGASLYLPKQERVSYAFTPLTGGDVLTVGAATIAAHHAPGHTPEHMVYELEGLALFTGDTLFTRGVGRPDLDAGAEEGREKARRLYRSLQELTALPEELLVLPGHTSRPVAFDGSVVGAALGEVKAQTESLQWSEEEFVERVLARVPPTPPNHEAIIARNKTGQWPGDDELIDLEAGANRCAVE